MSCSVRPTPREYAHGLKLYPRFRYLIYVKGGLTCFSHSSTRCLDALTAARLFLSRPGVGMAVYGSERHVYRLPGLRQGIRLQLESDADSWARESTRGHRRSTADVPLKRREIARHSYRIARGERIAGCKLRCGNRSACSVGSQQGLTCDGRECVQTAFPKTRFLDPAAGITPATQYVG